MLMIEAYALVAVISGVICTILVLFLPAIMELKKPVDAGPRLIPNNLKQIKTSGYELTLNIDQDLEIGDLPVFNANYFVLLGDMET
jgi:hypothetical protein